MSFRVLQTFLLILINIQNVNVQSLVTKISICTYLYFCSIKSPNIFMDNDGKLYLLKMNLILININTIVTISI